MSDVTLQPATQPFAATITPPGSKSLTNRALVLGALSDGICDLSNVLFADDTLVMMENLIKLGFWVVPEHDARTVRTHGRGGRVDRKSAELFCGNSGTTIRFLTALCALGHGSFTLDGMPRMRQRPMGQLVDLLKNLGVRVEYVGADGFPPMRVIGHELPGGIVRCAAGQSSQFLSAVLMIAPYARNEVRVDVEPRQTSWPYVAMTMRLMDHFGVTPELVRDPRTHEPRQIIVPRGKYRPMNYVVEPDATNAGYFLAAAAIHPGAKVTVDGLGKTSLQGDVAFADLLHRMGASLIFGKDFITIQGTDQLAGIEADLSGMPDMAQTLAVVAIFAKGETRITGLRTLRIKETDRIAALTSELRKLGAEVEPADDALTIRPPQSIQPAAIETHDDHRMAMSFAVAGTKVPGITIRNSECVNKTYPRFFDDLRTVRGERQ
ncbi:MAG: 3-phosphoshikimate 1-carboxyvinyltransferase [Tepidisphaeraceae bacterium]